MSLLGTFFKSFVWETDADKSQGAKVMIRGILIDLGDTLIEQRVDNDKPLGSLELKAFPDAQPALAELKAHNYLVAIVSNTSQSDAKEVAKALQALGLLQYVDTIVTSVDVGQEKPHPPIFLTALQHLGLSASEAVMVGDDVAKDIGGAQKLGMTTILVNRAKAPLGAEKTPTFVVSSLQEILPLLGSYIEDHSESV
jgi:HAD superfamily hydrolase (TIGR01662 family)